MKLTTFNMRQGGSLAHWAAVLEATEPDVLFVQESKDPVPYASDLIEPLELTGVHWTPVDHGRWGSALFIREGRLKPVAVEGFGGWVVGGEVELRSESALLFSVHLPPVNGSYVRAANAVLDALTPIVGSAPLILAGDWNVTVTSSPTTARLSSHSAGQELLKRLDEDFGLRPAWDLAHPEAPVPQTLRWARNPETPYHCDGIFLPEAFAGRLESVSVLDGSPWAELSDHNPVTAVLAP